METFEGFLGAPESILEASGGCLRDYLKNIVAFEGFLDAPESILEASGGCLFSYVKTLFSLWFSLIFEVPGACGNLLRR